MTREPYDPYIAEMDQGLKNLEDYGKLFAGFYRSLVANGVPETSAAVIVQGVARELMQRRDD